MLYRIRLTFLFFFFFLFSSACVEEAYANSSNYLPIPLSSVSNEFIYNAYPTLPLGDNVTLGGVPFNFPTKESGLHSYLDMDSSSSPSNPSEGTISVNVQNPHSIFLLLASGNSFTEFQDMKVGEVTLTFNDSSIFKIDITLGKNIREWCQRATGTVNGITDPNAKNVWIEPDPCQGGGIAKLDMLTIELPLTFRDKTLEAVKVDDTSLETTSDYDPAVNWYGLTVGFEGLPSSPSPLILLPGFGASWNYENIILGIEKPATDWYMTPFVKVYDGLIQTLKNAGYATEGPDKNLYIFNYNWARAISITAEELRNYIDTTVNPPAGTKVDLVGHSMGGLVARTYAQDNPITHKANQIITIGSPHQGAVKTYFIWEGAELYPALNAWQAIGARLILKIRELGFENNVETLQSVIPSLKDLLPTFNYLRKGTIYKPLSEMKERNFWLEGLNQSPPASLISILSNIVGLSGSESTLSWIMVGYRSPLDEFLGKWVDGKPVGQFWESGDETVLAKSARLEGANIVELEGINHCGLVETTTGQQTILNLLGATTSEIVPAPEVNYIPSLIFQLASPATLTVYGPDGLEVGESYPDDKLVFVPNAQPGEYQAQVSQEGEGGEFQLLIGKILPDTMLWQTIQGQTTPEPQTFDLNFTQDSQLNKLELLSLAKATLIELKAKILTTGRPSKRLLAKAVEFRIKQVERAISLLQKGRDRPAQKEIEKLIFSLAALEKNLPYWQKLVRFSPELKEEILEDLGLAKDYLTQAYEL